MSSRRAGKYACLELERKYLLIGLPPELDRAESHWIILDHYLPETRLRLRKMAASQGDAVQYKLGQKYRLPDQPATATVMTNLYLTRIEYEQLLTLGGLPLRKRRYTFRAEGRRYSVDLFLDGLTGLILAETECESQEEVAELGVPPFACADVTGDPFFSGAGLAAPAPDFPRRLAEKIRFYASRQPG